MALVPFTYRMDKFSPGPANSRVEAIGRVSPIKMDGINLNQEMQIVARETQASAANTAPSTAPQDHIDIHVKVWHNAAAGIHNSLGELRSILVAYDGSPLCKVAIETAGFFARNYQSELHILQIVAPNQELSSNDTQYANELRAKIIQQLEPAQNSVHYLASPPVVHLKRSANVVTAIHETLAHAPYQLIIAAKHRKNMIEQFLTGSITNQLASQVKIPLLAIGTNGLKQIKKILVPFDGSHLSYPAIHQGIILAQDFHAELNLLHVATKNENQQERTAISELMQLVNWGDTSHEIRNEQGNVVAVLNEITKKEKVDLVIMTKNVEKLEHSTCLDFLDHSDVATIILHGTT